MSATPRSTELLSLSEASHALDCSPQTVRAWFDAGKLAGVRTRVGRLVYARDVERLAHERAHHARRVDTLPAEQSPPA
jgi:excisionase family DNA binding protein